MPPKIKKRLRPEDDSPEESNTSEETQKLQETQNEILNAQSKLMKAMEKLQTDTEEIKATIGEKKNEKMAFILQYSFPDARNFELPAEGETVGSDREHHFGADWSIGFTRVDDSMWPSLECVSSDPDGQYCVTADFKWLLEEGMENKEAFVCHFNKRNNSWSTERCQKWADMLDMLVDKEEITIEIHVTIEKIEGRSRPKLRDFGIVEKDHSDVIIKINEEEFYLRERDLAFHSKFFDSKFRRWTQMSEQKPKTHKELEFTEFGPDDFQLYLEVIHGSADVIEESNVERILFLANYLDSKDVTRHCEKYLLHTSKMSQLKKFQLSQRYEMEKLKEQCVEKPNTKAELEPYLNEHMDVETAMILFRRSWNLIKD